MSENKNQIKTGFLFGLGLATASSIIAGLILLIKKATEPEKT